MRNVLLDNISVGPLQKVFAALKVGELPDNSDVLVPIIIIRGKKGPTLTVTAAIHGDEVNGSEVCYQLAQKLEPEHIKGTLILLPICNPLAFNDRVRKTPLDGLDLNRCFPGKLNDSITYQIAYALFNSVIKKSNYIIDFHSGGFKFRLAPHVRVDPSNLDAINMAKAFGLKFIIQRKGIFTLLATARKEFKIPGICVEIGEGNRLEREYVNAGVQGVLNVMIYLNMIEGNLKKTSHQILLNDRWYVRSTNGGLLVSLKEEGEGVKKNEVVAEIHNLYSKTPVFLRSPVNGYVIGIRKNPQLSTGEGTILIYS